MTQKHGTQTLYIDEQIDRLNTASERFSEALAADLEKMFTVELKQTLLILGTECAELNRKEREQSRELRKTIRCELRKLTSDELAEVLRHIYVIKDRKE